MGNKKYLYDTFKNRLTALNLSDKEYEYYIEQNASTIETYVYPAYSSLSKHINKLKNTGTNKNGLCYFPEGKDYYELLVNNLTGSNRTIFELQALTLQQITDDLNTMQKTLEENISTIPTNDSLNILPDSNPSSILITLKNKLSGNFPSPPDVNTSIKYVEESMEDYLSPAFYLTPAIDNINENIIYINPQHMTDDFALFTTLAHEGYPGHL